MDTTEFKELKAWVESQVSKTRSLVVGFSGSYSSAVTLALLGRCDIKVSIEPTFVMVKDEPWRILLADQWVQVLGHKTPLQKVILNEVVDDLEDQIPNLKSFRNTLVSPMIRMGLEMTARPKQSSIVWCGDRNAYTLLPPPKSSVPTLCLLAHLSAGEVESLGEMIGVQDGWVPSWGGMPKGEWESRKKNYRIFDRSVGVVLAHLDHVVATRLEDQMDFGWMGWEPTDNHDRLVLSEILERITHGKRGSPLRVEERKDFLLLDSGFEVRGDGASTATLVGSLQFSSDGGDFKLRALGRTTQGQPVDLGLSLTAETVQDLVQRSSDVAQMLIHAVNKDGDSEQWVTLSLSQQAVASLRKALDDMAAHLAVLPPAEEVIDRPLTEVEAAELKARRERMANAPRPMSSRRR